MMTQEPTIKEWVSALRSGNYIQANEKLIKKNEDSEDSVYFSYCCLGVYCDLSPSIEKSQDSVDFVVDIGDGEYQVVSNMLLDMAPSWMSDSQVLTCVRLNDTYGWSFDQIADWVESGFEIIALDPGNCPKIGNSVWVPDLEHGYGLVEIEFNPKNHKLLESE